MITHHNNDADWVNKVFPETNPFAGYHTPLVPWIPRQESRVYGPPPSITRDSLVFPDLLPEPVVVQPEALLEMARNLNQAYHDLLKARERKTPEEIKDIMELNTFLYGRL